MPYAAKLQLFSLIFFYCAKTSILAKKFTVTQPIVLFFKTNYCKMVVKILTLSLTSSIPYKYKVTFNYSKEMIEKRAKMSITS